MPPLNDIVMLDARALGAAIQSRSVSCVELMTAYLDHIERINPQVNAIVSIRPREYLMSEARDRDRMLRAGEPAGPMHGFPHAVKDLEPTKGIRTTLGSPIFADFIPRADSILVERIRAAGAILIGKTNVPEFGLGSHSFNPVFGTTLNPYDLTRSAGGSSGGAAVALATRMLPVADGSDHAGSLRNPAAFNNVMGFRTSFGRVPSDIRDVFTPALAVHGPMARNAEDLAMLLSVIAGYDARVPTSIRESGAQFTAPLSRDFKGVRVAYSRDFGGYLPFEEGVLELCDRAAEAIRALGCEVEYAAPAYPIEKVWENWLVLRASQVAAKLGEFYADERKREMLKPEAQWEVERAHRITAVDLARASAARPDWYHAVREMFESFDYWILPAAQVFPFDASIRWPASVGGRAMDTYHRWMEVMIPVTMSGCPAVAVPAGFGVNGLPAGIQIVAPNHSEFACLQIAHAYENATGWTRNHLPPILA